MKEKIISNAELLLALISEKYKSRKKLHENELEEILAGSCLPTQSPFENVKFNYASNDKEELMWDIAALVGTSNVREEWKSNLERCWTLTRSGKFNMSTIIDVLEEYGVCPQAIKSNLVPISTF